VEEWLGQPVGQMRRELGFHPAQTDRRQLLCTLPSKAPSSANQIARCAFVSPTPPFSRRFEHALRMRRFVHPFLRKWVKQARFADPECAIKYTTLAMTPPPPPSSKG
jgi:hypothetical protein